MNGNNFIFFLLPYNSIYIIDKSSNHGNLPHWKCYSIQQSFLLSIIRIDQINILQFYNSIIWIASVILKHLLSINQIAKLQSTIWIDCNSNTEIFSIQNQLVNFSHPCLCSELVNSFAMGIFMRGIMFMWGILKGEYHYTVDLLFDCLESAVWILTIFVFICKTDLPKPVKQEVNSSDTSPLVFPCLYFKFVIQHHSCWSGHG
jgi:hypothetical protein